MHGRTGVSEQPPLSFNRGAPTRMSSTSLKKIIYALLFSLLLPLNASATSLSAMIDQAGLQRMLTQRIVKAYTQILMDVDSTKAQAQLEQATALFEQQLALLEEQAPDKTVRSALTNVELLWADFKPIVTGPVNQEGINRLLVIDDELLAATHQVVIKLQDHSGTTQAKLVNTAGRQRMLSQRIAKLYMLMSSGIQDAEISQKLQSARYEFEGAQADLKTAPQNTAEIKKSLAEVDRQWTIFKTSFQLSEGKYIPLLVALAAEKIFKQMDQVTAMYVQLDQ